MKTSIRKILILSFLCLPLSHLCSQVLSKKEFVNAMHTADISYYYDEDYEKAADLYESLLKLYPDNSNLSAKLGICYLSIDGRKTDALKLLIKASSNVVYSDNEYLEYGEKAPLDTYLYLAIAYHQLDSLQKAVLHFFDAKKRLEVTELFREEYINNQIRNCRYAMVMETKPLNITSRLFTPWLNEYAGACNPVLSKNDSVFIFTHKKDGETRIFYSIKSNNWESPVDITQQLGGYKRLYSNSVTSDGNLLILYMDDGGDGNLYYSQRKDNTWTKIKSLGKNINTVYWESHGFITPDGTTLYLASNRTGGEGDLDIWVSKKNDNGTWQRPVNCGNVINTPYNDNSPFFDQTSNTLLFSSLGHISMGGYDVFRSTKVDNEWSKPLGLPYSFNNTTDNTSYIFNNNGSGFITSLFNEKTQTRNIYSIVAEELIDKTTLARGTISLLDGMAVDPDKTQIQLFDRKSGILKRNISLTDKSSFNFEVRPGEFSILISHIGYKTDTINLNIKPDTIIKTSSLIDTALFEFNVKPGDYQVIVSHIGYKIDTINLNLPLDIPVNYITLDASLIPDRVFKGDFLSIKNILFDFDSYNLTEKAISIIEMLRTILLNYPELKIEVAGYTDEKGSIEYNRVLSDKRAQTVIKYLSDSGISSSRFIKKSFGKSNFVAVNTNSDGSDNPEGRMYNRRVTFGILDPHTGVIIRQESFTPLHLRHSASLRYSIILLKAREKPALNFFSKLDINEMHYISSIQVDSVSVYFLGTFSNKNDALKYLTHAKSQGFKDAYIATQYEINNASESLMNNDSVYKQVPDKIVYTIQLQASKKPLNMDLFKEISGAREIHSDDGYYRYVLGEYNSFTRARTELVNIHDSGFPNAFIKELNLINEK